MKFKYGFMMVNVLLSLFVLSLVVEIVIVNKRVTLQNARHLGNLYDS